MKHPVVIDKIDLSVAVDCLETAALQTQYVKKVQAKLLFAATQSRPQNCVITLIRTNTIYHLPIAAWLGQTNLQSVSGTNVVYCFGFNPKESQIFISLSVFFYINLISNS